MTYQEAFGYLLGNPMRDKDCARQAVDKVLVTKSASASARRLARAYSQELYIADAKTVQEHNLRIYETEYVD